VTGRILSTSSTGVQSVAHRDRTSCEVTFTYLAAVYWVTNPAVLDVLVLGLVRQWTLTVEVDLVTQEVVGARLATGHDSRTVPEAER
jgi:hypothetical protein